MTPHRWFPSLLALALAATPLAAPAALDPTAAARAQTLVRDHAAASFAGADDRFVARSSLRDADGREHVRLDREYRGLRVIGGDLVVHSDAAGRLSGISQTLSGALRLDTLPTATRAQAIAVASARFSGERDGAASANLVVYARKAVPALAYDVLLVGFDVQGTPSRRHVIVDTLSLGVLDEFDDVHTASAKGTGNSLLSGPVALTTDSLSGGGYALRDPSRGNHYTVDMRSLRVGAGALFTDADNVWGNASQADRATVAVDATYGQNLTWDYYLRQFGRAGVANDGKGAYSRVHYGRSYVNAFWSDDCFCMTYGDGNGSSILPLVSVDVAGHEMTHGVTSRTAALIYSGESGGLNEAVSDILGTMVEYYAANTTAPANYLLGERLYAANQGIPQPTTALRYLFKPSLDGLSPDCYYAGIGNLDVHYSSGVANHFYYLLAEGTVVPAAFSSSLTPASLVCAGSTALQGIGRDAASKIVYRALTVYMTSSTNYAGARQATLSAARDLYGPTSPQYSAVAAAWSAVSVN